MKFLGIDYGTKRVGIAISDEGRKFAFPKCVLKNDKDLFLHIIDVIKNENISQIILGESLDNFNQKNILEIEIEKFIEKLDAEINLPIAREKEFFTSFEAHTRQGKEENNARETKKSKTQDLDAKAAAIILQRYLDKLNK